jgi:3-hydroxyacyl-CoA dehydrogenase
MSVAYEVRESIALALVDRPPVNAIDAGVRAGLIEAVRRAETDLAAHCLVIACRGRTFLSGADLSELGAALKAPGYRETLAAIEDCAKPVIAALHGAALGGGLEVALAAHYRCAAPSARMGMPEITLGIVPGAGGTQRLPRLIGSNEALELMLSGAPISAGRAFELGLIDAIVAEDVVEGALAYARRLIQDNAPPRPTRVRTAAPLTDAQAALDRAARALKGRTTQHDLVRAIAAANAPFEDGLQIEADISAASLHTAESRALRHVFFAERECARVPAAGSPEPTPIARAAVVGAGTMGAGIVIALVDAGLPVTLIEADADALARGLSSIRANFEASVKRGRLTFAQAEHRFALITGKVDLSTARDADVVIEAVFEDMALKRSILKELDDVAPPHALLASNTSSLSITELGAATGRPENVIGLHFFSPANVMRLLEIVRGEKTSLQSIATGLALGKSLRKVGVVVGDGFGFVGNRMMLDGYFREAELLLLQGVSPEHIDAVMQDFGFAMGPNRVNDMAGVDVGTKVRRELAKREWRAPPYHAVSDALTSLGRLGQKTGKGVYRYAEGERTPLHDSEVDALIARLAVEHGIEPANVSDQEIVERCVLSLVNIGAAILDQRYAYRAGDIDVIWTSGYGFPRWRGGPMHYADDLGIPAVAARVAHYHKTLGDYWRPAPLLERLAREGGTFASWDQQGRVPDNRPKPRMKTVGA